MKKLILIICICLPVAIIAQQETQYTQNQFNSNLQINPAYAGANDTASVSLRCRKQWVGFDGSPFTFAFNGETNLIKNKLALGATVIRDNIGITQSTSADLSLATHIRITEKSKLSFGVKAGLNFLNSDFSKLSNVDVTDPLYVSNKATIPYLGLGALFHSRKIYAGLAIPRLVSFENVSPQSVITKPHYYLYGGSRIVLNPNIELRPALLFKYVTAAPLEADIALDAWYNNIVGVGVSYRTSDAFNFMIKVRIEQLYIGYSYDMTVSGLRTFNIGSHEVYLGFEFGKKGKPDRSQNNRYF